MKLTEVIAFFGDGIAVADALSISQPAVAKWKRNGIPRRRQYEIQEITNGALKAEPFYSAGTSQIASDKRG